MEGQIEGHPARLLLRLDGWMSIFYEANGQIYLYQVWNVSSAMYDVMIRLEAADVAVVREAIGHFKSTLQNRK